MKPISVCLNAEQTTRSSDVDDRTAPSASASDLRLDLDLEDIVLRCLFKNTLSWRRRSITRTRRRRASSARPCRTPSPTFSVRTFPPITNTSQRPELFECRDRAAEVGSVTTSGCLTYIRFRRKSSTRTDERRNVPTVASGVSSSSPGCAGSSSSSPSSEPSASSLASYSGFST